MNNFLPCVSSNLIMVFLLIIIIMPRVEEQVMKVYEEEL